MNFAKAFCKDSFSITGRGIVVDLMHNENGITNGAILFSEKTKRKWEVKARILFDHAVDIQKIFPNEQTEYMLLRFADPEKRDESRRRIKEWEEKKRFQYLIKPIGHDQKPEDGEELLFVE